MLQGLLDEVGRLNARARDLEAQNRTLGTLLLRQLKPKATPSPATPTTPAGSKTTHFSIMFHSIQHHRTFDFSSERESQLLAVTHNLEFAARKGAFVGIRDAPHDWPA